jgi:hypothetical protein
MRLQEICAGVRPMRIDVRRVKINPWKQQRMQDVIELCEAGARPTRIHNSSYTLLHPRPAAHG